MILGSKTVNSNLKKIKKIILKAHVRYFIPLYLMESDDEDDNHIYIHVIQSRLEKA